MRKQISHNTLDITTYIGPSTLNRLQATMIRRPDTSNALVQTLNRLVDALQFLPASLSEQSDLLGDLIRFKIPHADHLLSPIDVDASNNGVLSGPWGYADFNLRVGLGEGCKVVF